MVGEEIRRIAKYIQKRIPLIAVERGRLGHAFENDDEAWMVSARQRLQVSKAIKKRIKIVSKVRWKREGLRNSPHHTRLVDDPLKADPQHALIGPFGVAKKLIEVVGCQRQHRLTGHITQRTQRAAPVGDSIIRLKLS